jgi:hypothetical protein
MAAYCSFDVLEVIDPMKLEDFRSRMLAAIERYAGR